MTDRLWTWVVETPWGETEYFEDYPTHAECVRNATIHIAWWQGGLDQDPLSQGELTELLADATDTDVDELDRRVEDTTTEPLSTDQWKTLW